MIWTAKVLLLVSLNTQADRSERECAFLQYMDYTRPLDGINKEIGSVCNRWSTPSDIHYNMRENDKARFSVGKWFWLESSSTKRGDVNSVSCKYSVQPFCNHTVCFNHLIYLNRFYSGEKVPKHRVYSEPVVHN